MKLVTEYFKTVFTLPFSQVTFDRLQPSVVCFWARTVLQNPVALKRKRRKKELGSPSASTGEMPEQKGVIWGHFTKCQVPSGRKKLKASVKRPLSELPFQGFCRHSTVSAILDLVADI